MRCCAGTARASCVIRQARSPERRLAAVDASQQPRTMLHRLDMGTSSTAVPMLSAEVSRVLWPGGLGTMWRVR
jgi:hypothetical protein